MYCIRLKNQILTKMKKRLPYSGNRNIIIAALLFIAGGLHAQSYERSKHISESYPINNATEIQVNNKYGNVHVFTWDKDSVRIEIDVLVRANKQSKVDKIYDYIDFEFTGNEYYVIAKTLFQNNRNSVWSELTDIAKTIFSSENKAQIDYEIYVPASNPIKISNKFGNIYTTDHNNEIEIILSNGDLKAHAFNGKSLINIEFGTANVNHIRNATLEINYAQFNADIAEKIIMRSKSSEIRIEDLKELDVNSRRDKLYLNTVGNISGEASFSYFYIKNIYDMMVLSTDYGEINIDNFLQGFQLLDVNSNYTDYNLIMPKNIYFDLELNHNSRTVIDYPGTFTNLKKKTKNAEEETYVIYGFIGEQSGEPARIDIDTKSGKIVILQY